MGYTTDIDRILRVPRATPEKGPKFAPGCARELRPIQARAFAAMTQAAKSRHPLGVFLPIGVGHGKTGICELAPTAFNAKRPLLLLPPDMLKQHAYDRTWWGVENPPKVLAYSMLSQPTASSWLENYNPDLIIADECQNLRHSISARTKRVIRYFRAHPETRFVGLTGTITNKSILEYSHLIELALRHLCPLPLTRSTLEQWASVLDVRGEPDNASRDALRPLVEAFAPDASTFKEFRSQARTAFAERLRSTPGVIATEEASCSAALVLSVQRLEVPQGVALALQKLSNDWVLPDGTEIVEALAFYRAARQLSCGFYHRWDWQGREPDLEWLEARNEWSRQARRALRSASKEGHDSVKLVALACAAGKGPRERVSAWHNWCAHKHKEEPDTEVIWLDDFVITAVKEWTRTRKRGIIWYQSKAIGEALKKRGFQVFGAGSSVPPDEVNFPALSIGVFTEGKNLQGGDTVARRRNGDIATGWSDQLIVEMPSGGATSEQLLGRTHRQGQDEDTVRGTILGHTFAMRAALESACAGALYIEESTKLRQKLNFCSWS